MSKKNIVKGANAWLEWQTIDGMDFPYFKITFEDVNDEGRTKFRIVPTGKFNGKIVESLQNVYMESGMARRDAAIKAASVCNDFYTAADKLSKDGTRPFKVYITKHFNT